ncbi:hypothetical protein Trydic_g23961 [Trypoxylus dichotomus]
MSGSFNPLLIVRGKLDPTRKIRIYKTVLRPIVTYASSVWTTALTTHMHKLQTFQNWIPRIALNSPWFVRNTTLHEDAEVEPLMDFIRRIPWKYPRPRSLMTDGHQD